MNLDFLNPINAASSAIKSLVDVWKLNRDRNDQLNSSAIADLTGLLEELRKTHSTIVKLVSPLRRIPDSPTTFAADFNNIYFDFRDFYDAYDFGNERTHCHKVNQIQNRLFRRKPIFGSEQQWAQLQQDLAALADADFDIIDSQFKPFMEWFNATMDTIKRYVDAGAIDQALQAKKAFLDDIGPEYGKNKGMLEEMTNSIGHLTSGL